MTALCLYLTEIAPPHIRGFAAGVRSIAECVQVVILLIVALPQCLGTNNLWYYYYLISVPFALCGIVGAFTLPETPKFLYLKLRNTEEAKKVILKYYSAETDTDEVLKHFEDEEAMAERNIGWKSLITSRKLRNATLISAALLVYEVTSGKILINLYSVELLKEDLQLDSLTAKLVAVGFAALQIPAAMVGAFLIKRFKRRPLFFTCSASGVVSLLLFVLLGSLRRYFTFGRWISYLCAVLVNLPILIFTFGPEVICLLYIAEVIPQQARATSMMIATSFLMLTRLSFYQVFPIASSALHEWALLVFCVVPSLLTMLFAYFYMEETAGKHVDEIGQQEDNMEQSLVDNEIGVNSAE